MSENEKPLVTFALFAYNQEKYIREAVESALLQDYETLELILSDDCSLDLTFEIMTDLVRTYTGPHKIILNRNSSNLGIGAHINRIVGMAAGELIVVAAGDDISISKRVIRLVQAWDEGDRKADSLCSGMLVIDSKGKVIDSIKGEPFEGELLDGIDSYFSGLQGASHAWSSRVFKAFGEIDSDSVCEDRVIPLRSFMMGGVAYIPDMLVMYRVHESNISRFNNTNAENVVNKTVEIHMRNLNILDNYIKDLAIGKSLSFIALDDYARAKYCVEYKRDIILKKVNFLCAGPLKKLKLIVSNIISDPVLALKWSLMLVAPSLYIRQQRKNLGIV